ncbi:MAG: methyltransferase domain-containing protein [Candidatus Margulisiibacteriota bacterium]
MSAASPLPHRDRGYELLRGEGIEIGALHQPARLPARCRVHYCDALPAAAAAELFPELDPHDLTPVEFILDLDTQGLAAFTDNRWDFAVLNHVIEHVANPIRVVGELFRVVRPGGFVVISAPDKRYTYDRDRGLTGWDHLYAEYRAGASAVTDEHWLDLLRGGSSEQALARVRARREHAHVWTSATFRDFLGRAFSLLRIRAARRFESDAAENKLEYFTVLQKRRRWRDIIKL